MSAPTRQNNEGKNVRAECQFCVFYQHPTFIHPKDEPENLSPLDPGLCRRRPPAVRQDGPFSARSKWPETTPSDWCGEWGSNV